MNHEYCNGHMHMIKKGDTLYALSRRYHVPLEVMLRANPYVDVYNLQRVILFAFRERKQMDAI